MSLEEMADTLEEILQSLSNGTNSPSLSQRDMHYRKKNSAHSMVYYRMGPPRYMKVVGSESEQTTS